jgi:hypothetical protein
MKKGVAPAEYNPELERIPSWCDRILYLTPCNTALPVSLLEYTSIPTVVTSDHSPIRGVFELPLRVRESPPPTPKQFQLIVTNLQGRDLLSCDSNGLSDPFLKFSAAGLTGPKKNRKTAIISKSLNPDWTETLKLVFDPSLTPRMVEETVLRIQVMDHDRGSRNDRMGECQLGLAKIFQSPLLFRTPVIHAGVHVGYLSGSIAVQELAPSS